ncbi:hypothetical protein BJ138DRAFT_1141744 [Hygrophoropsis aurantiaca]|uniref:Uncharacterized protein n=1 Tax=Hygrophoropsis aurantiaca TaxID=72124 RepID=A0ACB8AQ87_9AGAM|nr:hypothetical protein BJ138DRAFT_1141744 [Hygrophoropsis aurantiaca]
MSWFKRKNISESPPPPGWAPAPEPSRIHGLFHEATEDEYEQAEAFIAKHPVEPPKFLPSHVVEQIATNGCKVWNIINPPTSRFSGSIQDRDKGGIKIATSASCKDVCLMSDLPIMAGLYDIKGKFGVYYEVTIDRMDGIIAIGTACRPYPSWRLPGWNRLSAGLHLDDFHKFFEDPCGGREYIQDLKISSKDTIGCGYVFSTGTIFFTYNGTRLPPAFTGVYLPRTTHDVYAAIGVEGINEFSVNFGNDVFKWAEGNEWSWKVEGHVGCLSGSSERDDEGLPAYSARLT